MLKVGELKLDEHENILILNREFYQQGNIFKDEDAYRNRKSEPCYVPELSDSVYTGEDFLNICNGQQEFADELFDGVDWQHPESLKEDWIVNNEWVVCDGCGKLVNYGDGCNDKKCSNCGKKVEVE